MSKILQVRVMSQLLAINDGIALLIISLSVVSSLHPVDSSTRFMMAFFVFRVIFYVVASVIGMIRRVPSFYIPAVYEMDDEIYWSMVLMAMFAMKYTFADRFVQVSPIMNFISLSMATYFVVTLLMRFQSQHWSIEMRQEREERIMQLASKVSLSNSELGVLKPFFIERVQKNQRVPIQWRVIGMLVTVVIGAIISTYVDNLFGWIGKVP